MRQQTAGRRSISERTTSPGIIDHKADGPTSLNIGLPRTAYVRVRRQKLWGCRVILHKPKSLHGLLHITLSSCAFQIGSRISRPDLTESRSTFPGCLFNAADQITVINNMSPQGRKRQGGRSLDRYRQLNSVCMIGHAVKWLVCGKRA